MHMKSDNESRWTNRYTWLLVINAVYILIFFLLMQNYS